MKISVLVENLRKGLAIASRGVSSRAQLPILAMIHIRAEKNGLLISATDLELSFRVKVRAKVEEEGELAVPAKLFLDLVSTLPTGVVEIGVEKQIMRIRGEKIKVEVVGQAAEEFPSLPTATGKGLELSVADLSEKLERVSIAAAKDDTRPILAGMLWILGSEGVTMVATDGYRLGIDSLKKEMASEAGVGEKFVLPVRALMELTRALGNSDRVVKVEFNQEKQQVVFWADDLEMSSRLIAGEFPPYTKVIPTEKRLSVTMDREGLIEAVKRSSLFARDNANVIKLSIGAEEVTVMAQNDQMGGSQSSLEVEIEGEADIKVAFNARYLLDYLSVIKEERVKMETEGELKPAVFRSETGFLHVIMPVRTQN